MAYQTGTANDISDLLGKLAVFAQGLGWVVDKIESGTYPELFLHNSNGYWSLGVGSDTKTTLYILGNTGFNGEASYTQQPGSSYTHHRLAKYFGAGSTDLGGPFTSYDFFGTADYLHVVVQIGPGRFRHAGLGALNREGDYDGGQYAYGTRVHSNASYRGEASVSYHTLPFCDYISTSFSNYLYTSVVRAALPGNSISPLWYAFGSSTAGVGAIGLGGAVVSSNQRIHPDSLQVLTSQSAFGAVLLPVPCSVLVCGPDGLWRRLGTVRDFCICRMQGLTPRGVHEINGERWMVVPAIQFRESASKYTDGGDNSYLLGYIYRIIE